MEVFDKESLTVEEQLNLLIKRNLIVENYDFAINILKRVGYYHLSSYMRLFQSGKNHEFNENISFNQLYDFRDLSLDWT
ncbi:Abi family protein [bacterium]|nr:Abi family protein [bacterium]